MIKDELFMGTVFKHPPESTDVAVQRLQLMGVDPDKMDMAREAVMTPPSDQNAANDRVSIAGQYPTNLIGMVFRNVDQLSSAFEEMGWAMTVDLLMDSGRRRHYAATLESKDAQDNKLWIRLLLEVAPAMTTILNATLAQGAPKEWLQETTKIMHEASDEF